MIKNSYIYYDMKRNQDVTYLKKRLGLHIRQIRKSKKYSIEALAEKASLHTTYVGNIERGEANVTIVSLLKIAEALNVEIYDLFKFSVQKHNKEAIVEKISNSLNNDDIAVLEKFYWLLKTILR